MQLFRLVRPTGGGVRALSRPHWGHGYPHPNCGLRTQGGGGIAAGTKVPDQQQTGWVDGGLPGDLRKILLKLYGFSERLQIVAGEIVLDPNPPRGRQKAQRQGLELA